VFRRFGGWEIRRKRPERKREEEEVHVLVMYSDQVAKGGLRRNRENTGGRRTAARGVGGARRGNVAGESRWRPEN